MKLPLIGWCLLGWALAQDDPMESNAFMRLQPGNFSCLICRATVTDGTQLRLEASSLSAHYTLLRSGRIGLRVSGGRTSLNRQRLTKSCQSLNVKAGDRLEFQESKNVLLEWPQRTACE